MQAFGPNMNEVAKRARVDQDGGFVASRATKTSPTVRIPSPAAGAKRTSTDLHAHEEEQPRPVLDPHELYKANKQEIDEWYDEQHIINQGIPRYGKKKHIRDVWYTKVDAWMKHNGLTQPPKKKRRLNDGSAVSEPLQDDRSLRPHRIKHPGDLEPVPECPFDKLTDFEQMPNGRYPCSHINLDPPHSCCIHGMTRQAKEQAIKKSKVIWKGKVERLIDEKRLSEKHKTWKDWTVPRLRKKYQPKLHRLQEERKAEKRRLERIEQEQQVQRRMQTKRRAETGTDDLVQGEGLQAPQKRILPPQPKPLHDLNIHLSSQKSQQLTMLETSRPMAQMHDRSSSSVANATTRAGEKRQSTMQTSPRLRKKARTNITQVPQNYVPLSYIPMPAVTVQHPYVASPAQVFAHRSAAMATIGTNLQQHPPANVSFEIWDHEMIDGELDRILATNSTNSAESANQHGQLKTQRTTSRQIKASPRPRDSFLTLVPQAFATGNPSVDSEMQHLLEYAYRTDSTPEKNI